MVDCDERLIALECAAQGRAGWENFIAIIPHPTKAWRVATAAFLTSFAKGFTRASSVNASPR